MSGKHKRVRHWRVEARYLPSGLRYWWNSVLSRPGYDWVLARAFSTIADARMFRDTHTIEPTFFRSGREARVVRKDVVVRPAPPPNLDLFGPGPQGAQGVQDFTPPFLKQGPNPGSGQS